VFIPIPGNYRRGVSHADASSTPLSERRTAVPKAPKVLVTGTHSTGKTTLILDIVKYFQLSGVEVVAESARNCPFVLNRQQNLLSTTWLVATQLRSEVEAQTRDDVELVVCDRGLPDILAYHEMATGTVEPWLVTLAQGWLLGYDHVFVARPDPARSMSFDDLRINDGVFRTDVQHLIERFITVAGVSREFLPHLLEERRDIVGSWLGQRRLLP
jgi:predicted ATPase